jgi:hypothetical protein
LKAGKLTYALLSEWVKAGRDLSREEALRELAFRYFTSHGPATLQDFNWWSGLSLSESKLGLKLAGPGLHSEIIEGQTYWFDGRASGPDPDTDTVHLLPAYDEFVISYRDRSASLNLVSHKKAVSDNGIFYPTIVRNGQVIGTWKRTSGKEAISLTVNLFYGADQDINPEILKASSVYGKFTGKKTELIH